MSISHEVRVGRKMRTLVSFKFLFLFLLPSLLPYPAFGILLECFFPKTDRYRENIEIIDTDDRTTFDIKITAADIVAISRTQDIKVQVSRGSGMAMHTDKRGLSHQVGTCEVIKSRKF